MNRLLAVVMLGLVAGALIAGFVVVGGPGTARMEQRDERRWQALNDWGEYHLCRVRQEGDATCNAPLPRDRIGLSEEDFSLTRVSDAAFRVCTMFETDAARLEDHWRFRRVSFDGQEACMAFRKQDGIWSRD